MGVRVSWSVLAIGYGSAKPGPIKELSIALRQLHLAKELVDLAHPVELIGLGGGILAIKSFYV